MLLSPLPFPPHPAPARASPLPLPAAVACVLGANIGTTGTIWLAGFFVSDGMPKGDTLRIAMAHTGMNLAMAIMLLPFVHHIAKFLGKF